MQYVGPTEIWYHSLYMVIGHFAAYVVMLGTLVNIALLIATIQPSRDALYRVRAAVMAGAILSALAGALYFRDDGYSLDSGILK